MPAKRGKKPPQLKIQDACRAGDFEAVLAEMAANMSSAGVQLQGCLALASLAEMSAENEVWIAKAGGIEAVLAGMGAHGSSAGVQEQGCAALASLARNDENEAAIARAGGIEAVVAGMGAHGSSAG
ncbi:hypothetical protein T484DRAFT_1852578, partial [Baffinella frigidus]